METGITVLSISNRFSALRKHTNLKRMKIEYSDVICKHTCEWKRVKSNGMVKVKISPLQAMVAHRVARG
jgi:hypothetical protein